MSTFICPNCKKKQPLKKLFWLSNSTQWPCLNCDRVIKPGKMSGFALITMAVLVSFSTTIPGYVSILFIKNNYNFLQTILLAATGGLIGISIAYIYYYFNARFEEV